MSKFIVTLPPEVEQYENDIRRFVDAMVYKLKIHAKKGRWEGLGVMQGLNLMKGEIVELEDAIVADNTMEIITEAADVANYAMIVASIAIDRGVAPPVDELVPLHGYDDGVPF